MNRIWGTAILGSMLVGLAVAGPAHAADRRYAIQDFDRVVIEGPFAVRLTTGRTTSAVATGSPRALDGVSVEVQGQTLRIRRNPNGWGGYPGTQTEVATVAISARAIRSGRLIGNGSLEITGLAGLRVDLALEGNGRLNVTASAADNLSVGLRGGGTMTLSGRAGTFSADIQGSGTMNGSGLTAQNATIVAATSGEVTLAAQRTARVTSVGQGRVTVTGSAACSVTNPGGAEVRCGR